MHCVQEGGGVGGYDELSLVWPELKTLCNNIMMTKVSAHVFRQDSHIRIFTHASHQDIHVGSVAYAFRHDSADDRCTVSYNCILNLLFKIG